MKVDAISSAKRVLRQWLASDHNDASTCRKLLSPDVEWHCSHPVPTLVGVEAVQTGWLTPLASAFQRLARRTDIFMCGEFDGRFCGGEGVWVSVTGHYVGEFTAPLFELPASGKTSFLRFGEFYRVADGRIAEARILVDWVDLLRQGGTHVLPVSRGRELLVPGPLGQDGLLFAPQDAAITARSMERVTAMITGLHKFDGAKLQSMGMHAHWSDQMMWYGPCGIGTTRGVDGFQRDHQKPFLAAFPDRVGGNHRARIAEGRYVASTGWPSIRATHAGEYLGTPAKNTPITMRVMDWWRVGDETIEENWVLIDLPHLFLQMGVDLLANPTGTGAS